MTLQEILQRIAEIKATVEQRQATLTAEEIKAFNDELDTLETRKAELEQIALNRQALLDKIARGEAGATVRNFEPQLPNENTEYRNAFLKTLQGISLNDVEQRALNTLKTDGANLPLETQTMLLQAIESHSNLLAEIELLHVKGAVTYYVADGGAAEIHTEGKDITAAKLSTKKVELSTYEILKGLQISKSVQTMSVQAFEEWLVKHLAVAIAKGIENYIVNGTGSDQPKGVNAITWNEENSVTSPAFTAENVLAAIGLLPAEFDPNAKWIMSKKTLFNDFMPLKDKNKHDIVRDENGKYFVQGYEVKVTDQLAEGAILGDLKYMVGNLAEDVEVLSQYNIGNNTYQYLGVTLFDCKPANEKAFVKLKKA